METLTFAETLLVAVVGMLVVFFGLVVLIMLIKLMGALTGSMGKKEAPQGCARPRGCPRCRSCACGQAVSRQV